jgi:hypothetical protein
MYVRTKAKKGPNQSQKTDVSREGFFFHFQKRDGISIIFRSNYRTLVVIVKTDVPSPQQFLY